MRSEPGVAAWSSSALCAVHAAAGAKLESRAASLYRGGARVGEAYPVEMLRTDMGNTLVDENVQYVVHTLGPNANPDRPDPIAGDYKRGVKEVGEELQPAAGISCLRACSGASGLFWFLLQLRQCYEKVFAACFQLTGLPEPTAVQYSDAYKDVSFQSVRRCSSSLLTQALAWLSKIGHRPTYLTCGFRRAQSMQASQSCFGWQA